MKAYEKVEDELVAKGADQALLLKTKPTMLKALAGPFGHTGLSFVPTGGITAATLPQYLALPQVAAVGGSWMAERKLVADKAWTQITALTAAALNIIAQSPAK